MKKRILFSIMVLVILALTLVSPFPVAAKSTKTPICSLQTVVNVVAGQEWYTDNNTILHVRGMTTYSTIEPKPGCPEPDSIYTHANLSMKVNVELNLTTGAGTTWGSSITTFPGVNGTFVGPFVGKIENYFASGKSLGIGTGDLKGQFEVISFRQTGGNTYEGIGYVFAP